jgi:RNA 3'-terminal phosphate cyclase (ATP)
MIELDGAHGEGGGQILRTSLTLSLITGQPFQMVNIRAGRAKPGLAAQHLACILAAARVGQAHIKGATLGSQTLTFHPGMVTPGNFTFSIGTAGATALLLHAIYLPLALANQPSTLTLEGGTHVKSAPCFEFLDRTWRRYQELLGLRIDLQIVRSGFFPRGGGAVRAVIHPWTTRLPIVLHARSVATAGKLLTLCAGLPYKIAECMFARAEHGLRPLKLATRWETLPATGGPGCMLAMELNSAPVPTLVFSLGELRKTSQAVADDVVQQVRDLLATGGVDPHSADQIILPAVLVPEASQFPVACVTQHLLTNVAIIQRFLNRPIAVTGGEGDAGTVRVGAVTEK